MARALHWLTALGVFAAIGLGVTMIRLPAGTEDEVMRVFRAYSLHKTVGVGVLALTAFRIVWTLRHPGPGPIHPERRVENALARLTHFTLWIALLALPLTGLLHHSAAPGLAPILWPIGQGLPFVPADETLARHFRYVHETAGWLLMGALGLHLLGTLKHHAIDRDATLARMVRGEGPPVPAVRPDSAAFAAAVAIWSAAVATGVLRTPPPEPDPFDSLDAFDELGDILPLDPLEASD